MKNQLKKISFLLVLASAILNTACSSSGGDSGPGNASITNDNAVALATAGTEGVKQATTSSDGASLFAAKVVTESPTQKIVVATAQQLAQQPAAALTDPDMSALLCPDGGNVSGFDSISSGSNNGTISFNNCKDSGETINGSMTFKASSDGSSFSLNASFTVTASDGKKASFAFNASCTTNTETFETSCNYSSSGTGVDGRNYSVSDVSISGDDISGFTVSATVTDPDYGRITITTTTPVTFNCSDDQPDSGTIKVSDGNSTMTVTFIDCASFSINFNGSTTTHVWP